MQQGFQCTLSNKEPLYTKKRRKKFAKIAYKRRII